MQTLTVFQTVLPLETRFSLISRQGGNLLLSGTVDFTLSNTRQFYSSMGNPSGVKGLKELNNPLYVTFIM